MKNISNSQLLTLMILFLMGNTGVFSIGVEAKQDAWVAILIAMLMGLILLKVYLSLQNKFPNNNLIEIIEILFGKLFTIALGIIYTIYFMYLSFLILFNLGDFINQHLLINYSNLLIYTLIFINIIYVTLSGIETIGRLTEVLAYFLIIPITILGIIIIVSSKETDLNNLRPILDQGIAPVVKIAFSQVLTFPFGDLVVFLMYWKYLNSKKRRNKISIISIIIIGLLTSFSTISIISVLGVKLTQNINTPIMVVSHIINLGENLHGVDPLVVIIVFITGFIKLTISFYAAVLSFKTTFKLKQDKFIIILFALFLILIANYLFTPVEFMIFSKKSPENYIQLIFEAAIPILILFIYYIKRKKSA